MSQREKKNLNKNHQLRVLCIFILNIKAIYSFNIVIITKSALVFINRDLRFEC